LSGAILSRKSIDFCLSNKTWFLYNKINFIIYGFWGGYKEESAFSRLLVAVAAIFPGSQGEET
jgi:hypothetical protein